MFWYENAPIQTEIDYNYRIILAVDMYLLQQLLIIIYIVKLLRDKHN